MYLCVCVCVRILFFSWILYEKPGFQGRSIALEEGPVELPNEWTEEGHVHCPAMVIGSIKLAVRVSDICRGDTDVCLCL